MDAPVMTQLEQCLHAAIQDAELVTDILAACKMTSVEVSNLADWSTEQVAERLFLTPEESARLVQACRSALGGNKEENVPEETVPADAVPMPSAALVDHDDVVLLGEEESAVCVAAVQAEEEKVPAFAVPELVMSEDLPAPVRSVSPVRPRSSVPSYLRPTAAHTSRSKQFEAPIVEKKASPSPSKPKSKPGLMSRLLAPTAAFLARVTRSKAESKAGREAVEAAQALRKSQMLSVLLSSPQGQRVTKTLAFQLNVDSRPKSPLALTTEELEMQEAQKQQFKRHVVPAHVRESRSIEGFRAHSVPQDPAAIQQPFQLASLDMHAKYQEMREARLAAETKKAEEARRFKAQQMDKVQEVLASPVSTPRKVAPAPVTQGTSPTLSSASRAQHHAQVLDPARRARMSAVEREALEARERKALDVLAEEAQEAAVKAEAAAKEAAYNAMDVNTLRKSMVFKARDLPDFSSPFKPDHSKASPATSPRNFNFSTTKRLGEAIPTRDRRDNAAPSLSASACFSPNQFANLRSSQQLNFSRGAASASMRLSVTSLSPLSPGASSRQATPASPSTSRLALSNTRASPSSSRASRPAPATSLKNALEVALEVAASPRALSRRDTSENNMAAAHSPRTAHAMIA